MARNGECRVPALNLTSFFCYNKSQKEAIYYLPPTVYPRGRGLAEPKLQVCRHPLIHSAFRPATGIFYLLFKAAT